MKDKKDNDVPFEKAFSRLEEILEKMNSGETTLDDSLKLFEEADGLINRCTQRLGDAERRVETLIKNRGEVTLDSDGKPTTVDFLPPNGLR